jgi:hypothetical protein
MKRVYKVSLLFMVLGMVAAAGSAQAADLSGTWGLEVETPNGTGTPTFVLKQDGAKLSGNYQGAFGEAPVTGFVEGDDFEMTYTMSDTKVVYKGRSDGKTMSGKVDFGGQDEGKFKGKKK